MWCSSCLSLDVGLQFEGGGGGDTCARVLLSSLPSFFEGRWRPRALAEGGNAECARLVGVVCHPVSGAMPRGRPQSVLTKTSGDHIGLGFLFFIFILKHFVFATKKKQPCKTRNLLCKNPRESFYELLFQCLTELFLTNFY